MTAASLSSPIDDLETVRDWLRYGISRFRATGLIYGHGTSSALDEAAYLILHTLHLPPGELDPWLDARLTRDERSRILEIFETRIGTRKPAPYLTNEAWIGDLKFYVDENVIVPRSFIGELLTHAGEGGGLWFLDREPDAISSALDLCTGSGCLAILAALTFPNADVVASDISDAVLRVADRNVSDYGLQGRIHLVKSNLLDDLKGARFDLIIANPPYVGAEEIAAFPPEYQAEPVLAHAGGEDGLDLVRRILASAADHLSPGGLLLVEIGTGREILEAEFAELPFVWLDTEESEGEVFALSAKALATAAPRTGAMRPSGVR